MNQHPLGAGLSTVIMSFLLTTYYNVIMSWALFYLAYSFSPSLPWEVSSRVKLNILMQYLDVPSLMMYRAATTTGTQLSAGL